MRFPCLFTFALDEDVGLNVLMQDPSVEHISTHFALPLSETAFLELQRLAYLLNEQVLNEDHLMTDVWTYLHNSGRHSSASYYSCMFNGLQVPKAFSLVWKSKCLPKQKVFLWLIPVDRLNPRDMMERRHWHVETGVNCVLCSSATREDRAHLFFNCAFPWACWRFLNISWAAHLEFSEMIRLAMSQFQKPWFVEVIGSALWNIWKQRNAPIFEGGLLPLAQLKVLFKDLHLISFRVKDKHRESFLVWVRSL